MTAVASRWQVDLDLFQGPLQTLLDLIERRELPITQVSLVAVADQFLALVRSSAVLDLELTAEFLHVAARLLLLKSQALLPRPSVDEPREIVDDEEDLEARLQRYRRFRDVARLLAARQEAGLLMVAVVPPLDRSLPPPASIALEPARLRRAAQRVVTRLVAAQRARAAAPAPLIPFATVLHTVVEHLRLRRDLRFHDLAAEADDVIVAITMFLTVLELVRQQRLVLRQEWTFGPIDLLPLADMRGALTEALPQ